MWGIATVGQTSCHTRHFGLSGKADSVEIANLNIPNKSGECAKNLVFGTGIVLMV